MSEDDKEKISLDADALEVLREVEEILAKSSSKKAAQGSEKEDDSPKVVGGFAFFLSLAALIPAGLIVSILALLQINAENLGNLFVFAISSAVGSILVACFIRNHLSVLLHEFKHSLVSNLVGNKRKGMVINANSGHFEYAYTKKTQHLNALIALAPYIVPVFSFIGALLALAIAGDNHHLALFLIGCGYGADLTLNIRDISPVQTDLTLIRGGYRVGVLYVIAWNILIAGALLAWALEGLSGVGHILESVALYFVRIHQWTFAPGGGE